METTQTINIRGYLIHIENTAYELLSQYINQLKVILKQTEDSDDIIEGVETRIAEKLQQILHYKSKTVVEYGDVLQVLGEMGDPKVYKEFTEDSDETQSNDFRKNNTNTKQKIYKREEDKIISGVCSGLGKSFDIDTQIIRALFVIGALIGGSTVVLYLILALIMPVEPKELIHIAPKSKLYRDTDDSIIAGVCSGLGHFFNVDATIVRVISISILFLTAGIAIFIYIGLYLAVAKAHTKAEKLQMRNSEYSIENLLNQIDEKKVKGVLDQIFNFIKTIFGFFKPLFSILRVFISSIFTFIFGIFTFSLLIALIAFTYKGIIDIMSTTSGMPHLFSNKYLNLFYIDGVLWIVFVVSMLLTLFSVFFMLNRKNIVLNKFTKGLMISWIVLVIPVVTLSFIVQQNFKEEATVTSKTTITPQNKNIIYLNQQEDFTTEDIIRLGPSYNFSKITINPSKDSLIYLSFSKKGKGNSRENAEKNLEGFTRIVTYNNDSTLLIGKMIRNKNDLFRNQSLSTTISIPKNMRIMINKNQIEDYFDTNINEDLLDKEYYEAYFDGTGNLKFFGLPKNVVEQNENEKKYMLDTITNHSSEFNIIAKSIDQVMLHEKSELLEVLIKNKKLSSNEIGFLISKLPSHERQYLLETAFESCTDKKEYIYLSNLLPKYQRKDFILWIEEK